VSIRRSLPPRPDLARRAVTAVQLVGLGTLAGLLLPSLALAQDGFSTDIELVRPTFSPRATPGVDSPFTGREGTLVVGGLVQYQRDPLRLIEFDEVAGSVVRNRAAIQLGAGWAASDRVALRASMPLYQHWASETDDIDGDGFGVGDLTAGLKYQFWEDAGFTLAAHGDLTLNSGSRNRYMGEAQPRTHFGLLASFEAWPVLAMTQLGVQTRAPLETQRDFLLGNEMVWNSAITVALPGERASLYTELLGRFGLAKLFQGGAESSLEWTAGGAYRITEGLQLHAGLGRGLTAGYGTTTIRGLVGLRYQITPEPPPPVEPTFEVSVLDIPDDEPDPEPPIEPIEEPPDPDTWREGELARQVEDRIVIRDPIQFEFATARILPASLPTLQQVARLVNRDARIGHLLIEGHASEEGSYAYNYDLSIRRAKAIFEQLLVLGVHPERMSYRGMGEVVPVAEGSDEASLELNRRVEFEIIRQYQPGDETPEYDPDVDLPWNGEDVRLELPPPLPPPQAPPTDLLEDADGVLYEVPEDRGDLAPPAPDAPPETAPDQED
jgi:outer membrane protein OmpA-like peptidoglycan-associated protein